MVATRAASTRVRRTSVTFPLLGDGRRGREPRANHVAHVLEMSPHQLARPGRLAGFDRGEDSPVLHVVAGPVVEELQNLALLPGMHREQRIQYLVQDPVPAGRGHRAVEG